MRSPSLLLALALPAVSLAEHADVVIYGGTTAAVIAAVQARRMGKSTVIVSPDTHLGGLSSGGLGFTDTGNKAVIGGLAREFYHRIWQHYQLPASWPFQSPADYGNKGQGTPAIDGTQRTMWIFEPHAAENVFENFIREYHIPVHRNAPLDRSHGIRRDGTRIVSLTTKNGLTFSGGMFIDATYEGDLMAAAGASWHAGRESTATYKEKWNGVQTGTLHHRHHFGVLPSPISPFKIPGNPGSGTLPLISTDPPGTLGSADHRIQAYCFRLCLTNHPENRVPFPKPDVYNPDLYELLLRVFNAGWRDTFAKFDPVPNHKTDTNNHGPVSFDFIGANYLYPDGDDATRARIVKEHRNYQQGWLYFIANDPRVPADVRSAMQSWGLAKDEFTDNGHWPHQLYIREARRLTGEFVMTELELTGTNPVPDPVGMGSYTIDSHNVQRYITPDGHVQNEGDIGAPLPAPYPVSWRALLPKRDQLSNLLVPVCLSSSHIAFGSIRMEPVFMILAQSAATGACLALDRASSPHEIPYQILRDRLAADGQILSWPSSAPDKAPEGSITIDDSAASLSGSWKPSSAVKPFHGTGYHHDSATANPASTAVFNATLPHPGAWEIQVACAPHENRAPKVRLSILTSNGPLETSINQQLGGKPLFISVGTFNLPAATSVTFSSKNANGHVILDAVRFIPAKSPTPQAPTTPPSR